MKGSPRAAVLAFGLVVIVGALPAAAQDPPPPDPDTTAVSLPPEPLVAEAAQMPEPLGRRVPSPGTAFLRSVLVPGWGQASVGSHFRGGVYFAAQAGSGYMTFKTATRLRQARGIEARMVGIVEDSLWAAAETDSILAERLQDPRQRRRRLRGRAPRGVPGRRGHRGRARRRHAATLPRSGREATMREASAAPIGIFDSGVGGLTVFRELRQRLPGESLLYFGDTARVPYGPKSPETVRRYAREAGAYLMANGVKAVVVACNTATAHACELLHRELPVPVVGVIEPGARAAATATKSGRVGVVGTAGTIASGAYDWAVRHRLPQARVYAQACPLLVPLVEEGLAEHPATRSLASDYLRPLLEVDIDVLILGCTHYPLLRAVFAEILGPGVILVDSAAEAAGDVVAILDANGLHRADPSPPELCFAVSDSPLRFRHVGRHFLGDVVRRVQHVDVEGYGRAA